QGIRDLPARLRARVLLGGRSRIALDPASRPFAHPRLGGGNELGVLASELHVNLTCWSVTCRPGTKGSSSWSSRNPPCPHTPQPTGGGSAPAAGRVRHYGRATPFLRPDPTGHPLVSLTGHQCCRYTNRETSAVDKRGRSFRRCGSHTSCRGKLFSGSRTQGSTRLTVPTTCPELRLTSTTWRECKSYSSNSRLPEPPRKPRSTQ